MIKYKITHTTTYNYGEPVLVCQNELRLTPRDSRLQICKQHRLIIRPQPAISGRRLDYFGNHLNFFSIEESHRRLVVTATSRVEIRAPNLPDPAASAPWEVIRDVVPSDLSKAGLEAVQFRVDSAGAFATRNLRDYAGLSFPPGRPILEGAIDLMHRIHSEFKYDTTATTVTSTLADVFRLRRGVCQDFAHVAIGCLRALGLPARYVSGYLRTTPPPGRPRLVGADASHAWLSVYCGDAGWVDLDPTNDVLPTTDHITVAWGRDYHDVCPIKGVFVGGGQHTMNVSVDVMPAEALSSENALAEG